MRVISGSLGGQQFDSPKSFKTHPMSEKIRGALFNILGDISGLTILDAFAGSGALAIEAISRGASHATALDSDRSAAAVIVANAKMLRIANKLMVVQAPVLSWLSTNPTAQFDIVFADPPYADTQMNSVSALAAVVAPGGVFVISLPPDQKMVELAGFTLAKEKTYGDAVIYAFVKD